MGPSDLRALYPGTAGSLLFIFTSSVTSLFASDTGSGATTGSGVGNESGTGAGRATTGRARLHWRSGGYGPKKCAGVFMLYRDLK